ncbi:transposase, partial [Deinococcus roseus]|uniref:transposase n=1 Tax=Deinococcus roseus TaxID=392414 RepID=UPI00166F3FA1
MARKKATEYTPEFKQQAVQLATREGMTVTKAALDLGISYSRLHSWVSQAKTEVGRVAGKHCCLPAPSEPDLKLSPHPAQA